MNRSSWWIVCASVVVAALCALWSAPAQRAALSPDPVVSPASDHSRLASIVQSKLLRGGKPTSMPQEAHDFFMSQRFPGGAGDLPIEHLQAVREEMRVREARGALARGGAGVGGISTWTELGPHNVGGRARALVIDPTNPSIMYTAGVRGGVYKSTDAGANWTQLDDLMANMAVSSLAIDPTDTDILYAGTGEGTFGGSGKARGEGIFKSTDAGATWTRLNSTILGVPTGSFWFVNRIVISPNDPDRIYAATRYGVWRSTSAGAFWTLVLRNPTYVGGAAPASNGSDQGCMDLVVRNDRDPDVLFAAFGSFDADGLFRSDDGGDSWIPYTVPTNQGRMTLALAPSNNDILYLCMADNGTGGPAGQIVSIFRSTDGGTSFVSQLDLGTFIGQNLLSNPLIGSYCYPGTTYSQGWHDNAISVDPVDPDIVWVGGVELFRSDDGGQTFGFAAYWFADQSSAIPNTNYSHADNHLVVFHPDYDGAANQTVYALSDGGVYKSDNARAATSQEPCPHVLGSDPPPAIVWAPLNNGLGTSQFYHGDTAKDRDFFGAGAQDQGVYFVDSVSTPDNWSREILGDGGYVAIDPTDSDIVYSETHTFPSIVKSIDGALTFAPAVNGITDTNGIFITPFAMDQSDPLTLWTGGTRVWRTTDGAANWELARPGAFPSGSQISAVAIAPSDSSVVYLGFVNGAVAVSTDALAPNPTWQEFGFANGLPGSYVSSVAVHPTDPATAYVTTSNYGGTHVLRTTDSGATWTGLDGAGATGIPAIPAHWVAVRPNNPAQLYVATELGVFASDDEGGTWTPTNNGIPNTIIESLDFPNGNRLVAFTYGRGTFYADLDPLPLCDGDGDGNGIVDVNDIAFVIFRLGNSGTPPTVQGDVDGNGIVDVNDIAFVIFRLGDVCPL